MAARWVNHQQAVGNGRRHAPHRPIPRNMRTEGLSIADRPQKKKKKTFHPTYTCPLPSPTPDHPTHSSPHIHMPPPLPHTQLTLHPTYTCPLPSPTPDHPTHSSPHIHMPPPLPHTRPPNSLFTPHTHAPSPPPHPTTQLILHPTYTCPLPSPTPDYPTHSIVYSCSPTGMQKTNWMALHRRWNSEHLSTFMTPLDGGWPCQMGSSRKVLMRVSRISNMDRPQHSRSLVSRSPSAAMSACCGDNSVQFTLNILLSVVDIPTFKTPPCKDWTENGWNLD